MDVQAVETGTRRRSLLSYLAFPLIAFLLGLVAMGWLLVHWEAPKRWLGLAPPPAQQQPVQPALSLQPEPAAPAAIAPAAPGAESAAMDPETLRRLNRLEERLGQLDLQSRAAVGNADRAEALLLAFAARRALDRGVQLGYIEGMLRQRFAATQPQAVATVLTAARQPVTLQQLQSQLQDVAPHLMGGGPDQSWWRAFRTEMGTLITIRREGTPSTMPPERLKRAQQALDSGLVEVALVEVLRLPGRDNAKDWIERARRWVAARQALDTIETAALIDPPPPARPPLQGQPAATAGATAPKA